MNAILKAAPLAALLGAWGALSSPLEAPDRDLAWTSRGFADRLHGEAAIARGELQAAPDIDWADVRVRSVDDHAPLRVEVAWMSAAGAVPRERRDALLAGVRARFESFAVVDVILTERGR